MTFQFSLRVFFVAATIVAVAVAIIWRPFRQTVTLSKSGGRIVIHAQTGPSNHETYKILRPYTLGYVYEVVHRDGESYGYFGGDDMDRQQITPEMYARCKQFLALFEEKHPDQLGASRCQIVVPVPRTWKKQLVTTTLPNDGEEGLTIRLRPASGILVLLLKLGAYSEQHLLGQPHDVSSLWRVRIIHPNGEREIYDQYDPHNSGISSEIRARCNRLVAILQSNGISLADFADAPRTVFLDADAIQPISFTHKLPELAP